MEQTPISGDQPADNTAAPAETTAEPNPLEVLQQEKKAIEDKLLRLLAETENFKRRKNEDLQRQIKLKEEDILQQFLPVLDNLEKAIADMPQDESYQGLRAGIQLTEKLFRSVLEKFGITRVQCLGEPFDPNFHQAIGHQPKEGAASGTVINEVMAGYRRKDVSVRPALVIVAA